MSDKLRALVHFNERNNVEVDLIPLNHVDVNGACYPLQSIFINLRNESATSSGITYKKIDNYSFSYNGQSELTPGEIISFTLQAPYLENGHTYLIYVNSRHGISALGLRGENGYVINTVTAVTSKTLGVICAANEVYNNEIFNPVIIDVTGILEPSDVGSELFNEIIEKISGKKYNTAPGIYINLRDLLFNEKFKYSDNLQVVGEV